MLSKGVVVAIVVPAIQVAKGTQLGSCMRSIGASSSRSLIAIGLFLCILFAIRLTPVAAFARTSSDWEITPDSVGDITLGTQISDLPQRIGAEIQLVNIDEKETLETAGIEPTQRNLLEQVNSKNGDVIAVIEETTVVAALITHKDTVEAIIALSPDLRDQYQIGPKDTVAAISEIFGSARLHKYSSRPDFDNTIEVATFQNQPPAYEFLVTVDKPIVGTYSPDPDISTKFDPSTEVIAVIVGCNEHCEHARAQISQAAVVTVDIEVPRPTTALTSKSAMTSAIARTGRETLPLATFGLALIAAGLGIERKSRRTRPAI